MLEILANSDMLLPWNKPAWLVVYKNILLSNLANIINKKQVILDTSLKLIQCIFLKLQSDIIKLGCTKILVDSNSEILHELYNYTTSNIIPWQLYVLPYVESCNLPIIIKLKAKPIINHISEAIIISNIAQSLDLSCEVLINVRSSFIYADSGLTGVITLLESLPNLPNIKLAGFYLQNITDFYTISKALYKEVQRYYSTFSSNIEFSKLEFIIDSDSNDNYSNFQVYNRIGSILLGVEIENNDRHLQKSNYLADNNKLNISFSIYAWAYPIENKSGEILVQIDLGLRDGYLPVIGSDVIVESQVGKILCINYDKTIISLKNTPHSTTPWKCIILGTDKVIYSNNFEKCNYSIYYLIDNLLRRNLFSISD